MSYAERHMHTEHHIDSFDLESFFVLHDLNRDGFWDVAEIQAVYGLHHHSVKTRLPEPALIEGRADVVVSKVLKRLDTDKDRRVSLAEFLAGGTEGLPSFEGYRDLGHHYDEESEFFLHHEELYHSTPETQTDESYVHPEDFDHFTHHAHIEAEEDARERAFAGLPADADLSQDHVAVPDALDTHQHAPGEGPQEVISEQGEGGGEGGEQEQEPVLQPGDPVPAKPRLYRADPGKRPDRLGAPSAGPGREDWNGAKDRARGQKYAADHGRPRSPEERLKAGVPYKYKIRKGLRADEF